MGEAGKNKEGQIEAGPIPHGEIMSMIAVDDALKFLGVRAPDLLDPGLIARVAEKLGMGQECAKTLSSLERQRVVGRLVVDIGDFALVGGLGMLSQKRFLEASVLFVLKLVCNGFANEDASKRLRLLGSILGKMDTRVQSSVVGSGLKKQIGGATKQAMINVPDRERWIGYRAPDLIGRKMLEFGVVSWLNPAALPYLLSAGALLWGNSAVVRKLYGRREADYQKASVRYQAGEISLDELSEYVNAVAKVTPIINGITTMFQVLGFAAGPVSGEGGAMVAGLEGTSAKLTTVTQGAVSAEEANSGLEQLYELLLEDLDSVIDSPEDLYRHAQAEEEGYRFPRELWMELLGKQVNQALILDLGWSYGNLAKKAEGIIEFAPELGPFYLFGKNGSGKSTLVRAILQMDRRHRGFAGLWMSDWAGFDPKRQFVDINDPTTLPPARREPRQVLVDFHSASFDELKSITGYLDANMIQHQMKGGLVSTEGLSERAGIGLLEKFGFGGLKDKMRRDISSLSDKSRGEQRVLATLKFLEDAKSEKKRLVVLDELFAELDLTNVQRIKKVIESYSRDGLMIVVVGQNPEQLGGEIIGTRGATIDDMGMSFYDSSFVEALHRMHSAGGKEGVEQALGPLAWKSLLNLQTEINYDDMSPLWEEFAGNSQENLALLKRVVALRPSMLDDASGLIGSNNPDHGLGFLTEGFAAKWRAKLADPKFCREWDGEKHMLTRETRLFIKDLIVLKELYQVIGQEIGQEYALNYAGTMVKLLEGEGDILLDIQSQWFGGQYAEYYRENASVPMYVLASQLLQADMLTGENNVKIEV